MDNEILDRIRKDMGYVEDYHRVLAEKDPDLLKHYVDLWESVFINGSLDNKTVSLVRLAAIAALHIEKGLDHGMDFALAAGASEKEIMDVLKVAYLFAGNASLVPAMQMASKKFHIE